MQVLSPPQKQWERKLSIIGGNQSGLGGRRLVERDLSFSRNESDGGGDKIQSAINIVRAWSALLAISRRRRPSVR